MNFNYCDLITKIPNLSMNPNIMQLILSGCTNLVEIDDSVRHLDKLKVWDLDGCVKLETLPNCLTMKSLTYFNLVACESIKKFPNILHEMKGVKELHGEIIFPKNVEIDRQPMFTSHGCSSKYVF